MRVPLIWLRSLATLTLAVGCGALVVIWPGWFTAFRAEGTYSDATIAVSGNVAVSTAIVQSTNVSIRLGSLRGSGPGASGRGASADAAARGLISGRLGLFLNGQATFGDTDPTSREPGFDYHTGGVTAGADYKLTDNLTLGAAFGYIHTSARVDEDAGHASAEAFGLTGFANYWITKALYVDAILTHTWNSYDIERTIANNVFSSGSPDGDQVAFSVGSGYDFNVGALTVGPTLRANYLYTYIDRYREHGVSAADLVVGSQTIHSFTTDLGGHVTYAISLPWGVLSPTARFEWEHEFLNDSRRINSRLAVSPGTTFSARTNDPDRNYFNLGAGLSAVFKGGTSAFFYYEAVVGRNNFTNHAFNVGIRIELD